MSRRLHNVHPGEVLREEFLEPLGLTQYRLAKDLAIPETRVSAICNGRRSISPETALLLGKYLGTTPDFWLELQKMFDLEQAATGPLAKKIKALAPFRRGSLSRSKV